MLLLWRSLLSFTLSLHISHVYMLGCLALTFHLTRTVTCSYVLLVVLVPLSVCATES